MQIQNGSGSVDARLSLSAMRFGPSYVVCLRPLGAPGLRERGPGVEGSFVGVIGLGSGFPVPVTAMSNGALTA